MCPLGEFSCFLCPVPVQMRGRAQSYAPPKRITTAENNYTLKWQRKLFPLGYRKGIDFTRVSGLRELERLQHRLEVVRVILTKGRYWSLVQYRIALAIECIRWMYICKYYHLDIGILIV